MEEGAEGLVVVVDITTQGIEPLLTFVVSGDKGQHAEGIDITYLVDVECLVDLRLPFSIFCDDDGDLQSGDIERLAGRYTSDAVVLDLLGDGSHRNEMTARHGQLTMDLVAENHHIVADADIAHLLQFCLTPDPACGIVGTAEQEEFHVFACALTLKILKVNGVGIVLVDEFVLSHSAAIVEDGGEEAVIDRCLDQHGITRLSEPLDDGGNGWNDTAGVENPVFLDRPFMTTRKP